MNIFTSQSDSHGRATGNSSGQGNKIESVDTGGSTPTATGISPGFEALQPERMIENAGSSSDTEWFYDPDEHGFRRIVRNFAPSWYIITMGTGIFSLLLHQLPYNGLWLQRISEILFALNFVLFVVFTVMSGLRYAMYPELWGALFRDPSSTFFIGAIPTGLFTIINLIVVVCTPWGKGMVTLAWTLWWIDTVFSIVIFFHLTFTVINLAKQDLSSMTALWLLSIVPAAIASASGGIVAEVLPNPQHQLWTLIIGYILWGTSIPLAFVIIVLYFHRLTVHKMLSKEAVVTVFLPIAPLGLGGFALMKFGSLALEIFPKTGTLEQVPNAAGILYVMGFIVALMMWGFGIVWFFLALAMVIQSRGFPFSMGWWSFTFPIGVFALSTFTIGEEMNSRFFKVLGTVLTGVVAVLWVFIAIGTIKGSLTGKMFYAPCLETDMKLKERKLRKIAERAAVKKV